MKFLPLLGTDLSGSLGGITASHNRGGMYFRNRSIPVNPNSPRQIIVRNALSELVTAWNNILTAAQRSDWEDYAANVPVTDVLGQSRFLSGQQWYLKANSPRTGAGEARIDDAPVTFTEATLSIGSIGTIVPGAADVGTVEINFTNTDEWAIADGGFLFAQLGIPQNGSINFFKGPFRFAGSEAGAIVPPATPLILVSPFGISSNQKIFARARSSNADARLSTPQIYSALAP